MAISDLIMPGRRVRRPAPAPAPRRAAPAAAPAPESAKPAPPAKRPAETKRSEPATVRAIIVNPQKRTVEEVQIETEPGNPKNGFGLQVKQDAVGDILGTDDFETVDMADAGEVAFVDAMGDHGEHFWRYGEDDDPVGGVFDSRRVRRRERHL